MRLSEPAAMYLRIHIMRTTVTARSKMATLISNGVGFIVQVSYTEIAFGTRRAGLPASVIQPAGADTPGDSGEDAEGSCVGAERILAVDLSGEPPLAQILGGALTALAA
jgi:hypothetical protein